MHGGFFNNSTYLLYQTEKPFVNRVAAISAFRTSDAPIVYRTLHIEGGLKMWYSKDTERKAIPMNR